VVLIQIKLRHFSSMDRYCSAWLILIKAGMLPKANNGLLCNGHSNSAQGEKVMSYSTLMVHLDIDRSNDARLRVAGELAERFDARLIGTAAADVQPLYFMDGAAAQDLLEDERSRLRSGIADCEAQFRRYFKARANNIEWRGAVEFPAEFVARNARAADLLIAGGQTGRADTTRQIDAGGLALRAGRPVLVVPAETEFLKLDCVVVAWKDTREARRAVVDALPLLHKAREVLIVELLEPGEDQAAAKARVDDVAHWLVRRGISASSIATKALIGVTDRLTILAQDEGAGIIVAGAYGHSRLQEWVFGGVTRELLHQQKCCALLSH
jgi:nucleotide-binding universal stress UspA family protein